MPVTNGRGQIDRLMTGDGTCICFVLSFVFCMYELCISEFWDLFILGTTSYLMYVC